MSFFGNNTDILSRQLFPDVRTTARALWPQGEARATIESSSENADSNTYEKYPNQVRCSIQTVQIPYVDLTPILK